MRHLYLLGPDGKMVNPPTLFELVQQDHEDRLIPIVEALTKRNDLISDKPWQARVSSILDAKGRPYLVEIK